MITRLTMLFMAVAAGSLLVAGCGDDGEAAAPEITTSSLTKAEFVQQGNSACVEEKEKLLGRAAAYKPPANAKQMSAAELLAMKLKAVIVPTVEGEMAAIQALGAPEGEEEAVGAILAAQQQGLEELSDVTAVQSVRGITNHFDEATKLAERYGLANCVVVPEPNAPEVN